MLGIGLGKHHQLDIGGIAMRLLIILQQVVDFICRQRQSHVLIGLQQGGHAVLRDIDGYQQFWREMLKQSFCSRECAKHGFGHAIVQQGQQG